MKSSTPAAAKRGPSRAVIVAAVIIAVAVIGAVALISYILQYKEFHAPLVTAMGGTLTALALLWPVTKKFTGTGSLHPRDAEVGGRVIGIFGILATFAGVYLDKNLGLWGLVLVAGGGLIAVALFALVLFGTAPRRQRLDDAARDGAN